MTAAGWTGGPPLAIAHQGGAAEAPSSTMFAFAMAVERGVDMLELDVHATADGHLVVLHDDTVDRTTDGTGSVDALPLERISGLDAAHWFVPDVGTAHDRRPSEYCFRGVATGHRRPPPGFTPRDFTIPTLLDVLNTFTTVRVNIDIKRTAPHTPAYEHLVAEAVTRAGRGDDVMVASFEESALDTFRAAAPHVATSAGPDEALRFWEHAHGRAAPPERRVYRALQLPLDLGDMRVVTPDLVTASRRHDVAVHVWTIDDEPTMHELLDLGVDGVVTDRPSLLRQVLDERA